MKSATIKGLATRLCFWTRREPQVAVGGLRACHRVISHRHAGHFDDASLDGVNRRKIRDHPREKCAFGIARTAKKKRRGRKIVNGLHSDLGLHGL